MFDLRDNFKNLVNKEIIPPLYYPVHGTQIKILKNNLLYPISNLPILMDHVAKKPEKIIEVFYLMDSDKNLWFAEYAYLFEKRSCYAAGKMRLKRNPEGGFDLLSINHFNPRYQSLPQSMVFPLIVLYLHRDTPAAVKFNNGVELHEMMSHGVIRQVINVSIDDIEKLNEIYSFEDLKFQYKTTQPTFPQEVKGCRVANPVYLARPVLPLPNLNFGEDSDDEIRDAMDLDRENRTLAPVIVRNGYVGRFFDIEDIFAERKKPRNEPKAATLGM